MAFRFRKKNKDFTKQASSAVSSEARPLASELLLEKWRYFFRFLDITHDGTINSKDIAHMCGNLYQAYQDKKLDHRKKNLSQSLLSFWHLFQSAVGSSRKIATEEEFVQAMKLTYETRNAHFVAVVKDMSESMFDLIDMDGNGAISRTEYISIFTALGVGNANYLGRVFDSLDANRSGLLDRKEMRTAFLDFFMDQDVNNPKAFLFKFPLLH